MVNEKYYWINFGRELAAAMTSGKELPVADESMSAAALESDTIEIKVKLENKTMNQEKENADKLVFINGYTTEIRTEIANLISDNLRLSKNEAALLKYFATCSSGFRPANKTIEAATGLKHQRIAEAKENLEKKGIIARYYRWNKKAAYNNKENNISYIIEIDWKDLYRNAINLKDNTPKTIRVNGTKVRVPVVKEIPHINLTEADKLFIYQNSKSKCFRCDDDCENCPEHDMWNKKAAHNNRETKPDYTEAIEDVLVLSGEYIDNTKEYYNNNTISSLGSEDWRYMKLDVDLMQWAEEQIIDNDLPF